MSRSMRLDCAKCAADLYAQTRQTGVAVDDIDLLIAGTAVAHNMVVATHNVRHFSQLPGVIVDDWSMR
jgi:tRNA(fMet)-specific endonuclease VapC